MKIKSSIAALSLLVAMVIPAGAVLLTRGAGIAQGASYPYTQTLSAPEGSCDVIMDATRTDSSSHLFVSNNFGTIGIMKAASGASTADEGQINPDELLKMTITNLSGASVKFTRLNGINGSTYFTNKVLRLYKNGQQAATITCNGADSYVINPPIVAVEGDTISFNPTAGGGSGVRLTSFEVEIESYRPYITDGTLVSSLLNTVIATNGHYYVTADWSGLTHKPKGVVAKVTNGSTGATHYFRGAVGPNTAMIDFDLLVLQPGDTVQVLAGLTGNVGENPGLWNVSLARYDSWSGSRYSVPVVPLALASPLAGLNIQKNQWPKNSGFRNDFRGSQGASSFNNYVNETMGHAPKCYGEELANSWQNQALMANYAQSHPDWQAMVHWNGQMFKIQYPMSNLPARMNQFKPYHFRYDVGTYLSSNIIAAATQITVDNPGLFVTNEYNIAIVIPVDPTTGQRQFDAAELVTVTAIFGNQLTVVRNMHQSNLGYTSSGNFAAGSYIAPASQRLDPTRVDNGGMFYNLSLFCPVDVQGRNGGDLLAEMLSYEFAAGNDMERFHGIMLDVLDRSAEEQEDNDLDGVADGGLDARGVDLFHLGVQGMARKLRAALPDRIITFDGNGGEWPALHTVFNGMESEGFDRFSDSYTKRWSIGVNYYLFTKKWNPSDNFYNFCVTKQIDNPPVEEVRPLRLFHHAGLVAMGVAVNHETVDDGTGALPALDEIRNGVANQSQWLGAPVGELIRPGLLVPDVRGGDGLPVAGWSSPDGSATVTNSDGNVLVKPVNTGVDHDLVIEFSNISIPAGDLLIRFEGKGGVPHLPTDCPRNIRIEVDGRVNTSLSYDTLEGAVNDQDFTEVTAYYRSAGGTTGGTVTLRLIIEGAADMTLRNFTIHNAADTLLREFQNGIVLCNPSETANTFNLASLFPGKQFRRIQGQTYDDPVVNDGSAVGSSVQLGGYRGLFLEKVLVPSLFMDMSPSGLEGMISWSSQLRTTYQLQESTNLELDGWQNISGTVVGSGGIMSLPVSPVGPRGFYRLTVK